MTERQPGRASGEPRRASLRGFGREATRGRQALKITRTTEFAR